MTAVLLALLCAVVWGVANYVGPLLTRTHPLGAVMVIGQLVGVLGGIGLFALDDGAVPGLRAAAFGIAAGAFNGLALATFYTAAAAGPISVVAPIGATGGAVPVLVALSLGERPSALQLVGIPLAVAGVVLAAARRAPPVPAGAAVPHGAPTAAGPDPDVPARSGPADPARSGPALPAAGIGLSVLAALTFGTFLTLFAEASQDGAATAVLTSRTALLVCTVVVLLLLGQPLRAPLRQWPRLAVPGLLLFVGTAAYGLATGTGLVSVVSVLATLAPVVTVGLAVVLLGERLAGRQQVGVAVALAGVVLLAAG